MSSQFTGKERDTESNLDNFGARYYASTMGRFMTPDWALKPASVPYANFGDPQTLNLYTYVQNSPLNRIDADGHCIPWCTALGGAIIGSVIGAGSEIVSAKLQHKSIDWKRVEGAAVKGAIVGGAIGLAGPQGGAALSAGLGLGGNVVGGIADRSLRGESAKEVLSPKEVAKDAAFGAAGGAIGGSKVLEGAGEFVAQNSAKVAAASNDMEAFSFFLNDGSAIGTATAKTGDFAFSTAEQSLDQADQQQNISGLPDTRHCTTNSACNTNSDGHLIPSGGAVGRAPDYNSAH